MVLKNALRYTLLLSGIVTAVNVNGQANSPVSDTKVAATGNTVFKPAAYDGGISVNYIRTWIPRQPYTSAGSVMSETDVNKVNRATQYFDGLGRDLQIVNWQQSPGKKDIVNASVYDELGREKYKFLSYSATTDNGSFKTDPFDEQSTFFNSTYLSEQPAYSNEKMFYSKTIFEKSPLQRPGKAYAPGSSWVGSEGGADHATGWQYLLNTLSDSVRIWAIGNSSLTYSSGDVTTNIPVSGSGQVYTAGKLFKNVVTDEKGNLAVEYKDSEGKVLLKKVQVAASPGNAHMGWLCTYYVYDDFGRLRYVIPPQAVNTLLAANTWDLATGSNSIINELCFRYEYDGRSRMTAKKVPGSGWTYMIYDQHDRLVFTQDANLRSAGKWLYTLYDGLNRPVQTGMMTYTNSPADLQSYVNSNAGSYSNSSVTTSGSFPPSIPANLDLSIRQAGREQYHATDSITFSDGFSTEQNAYFIAEIVTGSSAGFIDMVIVADNPIPSGASPVALTHMHYDSYDASGKTYNNADNLKLGAGDNIYGEALPSANSLHTRGMATVSRVRIIEDPSDLAKGKWLETVSFYDNKGRAIQTNTNNYKNGVDINTSMYDFAGRVISNYLVHSNPSDSTITVRVLTNTFFDHAGRMIYTGKKLNDNDSTFRWIARNRYDALGQLLHKRMGQKSMFDTATLHRDDYSYNARGWLKGINWIYGGSSGPTTSQMNISANKWFAMDLSYDWGFTSNEYSGNISGQRWVSAGDGAERAFGYGYDAANRLLFADFNQKFSTWGKTEGAFTINYSVKMGDGLNAESAYDANGNIRGMSQAGLKLNVSPLIDNLSYHYISNSNKLSSVGDAVSADQKLGDFTDKNTGDDYAYDDNGNLVKDRNKDIGGSGTNGISYNHLNLPFKITVTGKGTITYIYDATGNKLSKITKDTVVSNKTVTTDYMNGFVYENNTLQFFGHEEGRIRLNHYVTINNPTVYAYDYFVKDHLGNTRAVLTDENKQDPYPAVTLEPGSLALDTMYYNINTGNIVTNPASLPSTYANNNGNPPYNTNTGINTSGTSAYMYKINASSGGDKTGLGSTLKVMAGDNVAIYGKSFWHSSGTTSNPNTLVVNDLLTLLANSAAVAGSGKNATASALTGSAVTPSELSSLLSTEPTVSGRPKAYINWILFDEQFRPVTSNSGFDPVNTSADVLKSHSQSVDITKNGYLYVYCSNESNQDVFFDNFQVIHTRGPLLEETHYYPFGLTMAGISSKAAGKLENRFKYNGGSELQSKEFTDGSGLEMYDTHFRNLDPQLGRWWQIDPKPTESESPYVSMGNNPILHNDILGDTVVIRYYHNNMATEVEYKNGMISPRNGDKVLKDDGSFSMTTVSDLNKVASFDKDLKSKLETMENSTQMHYIEQQTESSKSNVNSPESPENDKKGIPTGTTTKYNPWAKTNVRGDKRDPKVGLAHEMLGHGFDSDQGKTDYSKTSNGIPMYEVSGVKAENKVRAKTGDPLKTTYGGQPIPPNLLVDPTKKKP